jgi:hypothetical protein
MKRVLSAVRFVVRMQIGARNWARHEQVRRRLADCFEGMEREERIRKMRDLWRAKVATGTTSRGVSSGAGTSAAAAV